MMRFIGLLIALAVMLAWASQSEASGRGFRRGRDITVINAGAGVSVDVQRGFFGRTRVDVDFVPVQRNFTYIERGFGGFYGRSGFVPARSPRVGFDAYGRAFLIY